MKTKVAIIVPPALRTNPIPVEMMIGGLILDRLNKRKVEYDLFDFNFEYKHKNPVSDQLHDALTLFLNVNKKAEPVILKYIQNHEYKTITNLIKKFLRGLDFSRYDIIVIAALEFNHAKLGLCFAKYLKKISNNKKIVIGNICDALCCYVGYRISHLIEYFDFIDYLIENKRGYDMLLNLLNNYPDNLEKVRGLIYRKGNKIIYNKGYQAASKESFYYNIDQIKPSLNIDDKIMKFFSYMIYEVGRGCENTCFFCQINQYPYIMKSPQKVVNDIKILINRYHVSNFGLACSSINYDKSWLSNFLDEINKEKLHFRWISMAIPKNLNFYTLKKMADCGCVQLHLGFESRCPNRLVTFSKGINADETEEVLINCNKVGICVRPLFIVGLPHETKEEFRKIESFIKNNHKRFASIEIQTFKLIFGSPLFCDKNKMEEFRIRPRRPDVFDLNYIPYDEIAGMAWEEKLKDNTEKKNYLFRLCNNLGLHHDSLEGLRTQGHIF